MKRTSELRAAERALVAEARQARLSAYAPYSQFRVGAALRLEDGRVFRGCNVENASLGAAICAERSALVQAASAGARPGQLEALAVYTSAPELTPPCGLCLQCLVEFAEDLPVLLAGPRRVERTNLKVLQPRPFRHIPRERTRRAGRATTRKRRGS